MKAEVTEKKWNLQELTNLIGWDESMNPKAKVVAGVGSATHNAIQGLGSC